jgi:hypothetical protein
MDLFWIILKISPFMTGAGSGFKNQFRLMGPASASSSGSLMFRLCDTALIIVILFQIRAIIIEKKFVNSVAYLW